MPSRATAGARGCGGALGLAHSHAEAEAIDRLLDRAFVVVQTATRLHGRSA